MRKVIICVVLLALIGVGIGWAYVEQQDNRSFVAAHDLRRFVDNSYSENPTSGLPYDWLDCLERYQTAAELAADRVECRAWSARGATSTLYALKFGEKRVPVVETRLSDTNPSDRLVIEIVGGPGDVPFHVDPHMTEERIAHLRDSDLEFGSNWDIKQSPHFQLLNRGFTIASIGYWGTRLRTLQTPDEIELAMSDVRMVMDHYRDRNGFEHPLLTISLGNHLALGAIGRQRLEANNILALVPVMDGLQHHLARIGRDLESEKAEVGPDTLIGEWSIYNIYRKVDGQVQFDHSRLLPVHEFFPRYAGETDLPWKGVQLQNPCSKIVLGSEDPRTKDFLASNTEMLGFIEVWDSDHNLYRDAPEKSRQLFADFADCLIKER